MTDPDRGLVEGIKQGDLCTVQLLVSRKFHRLACLFQALMNTPGAEAEALATEILRASQLMIDSFDSDDMLFDTWLHRLAVNLWRENAVKPAKAGPVGPDGLMTLAERPRLCLVLSACQGLSAREIARILSLSIQQVESALKVAREVLERADRDALQNGAAHAA